MKIITVFFLLVWFVSPSFAKNKEEKIRELLDLSGSAKLGVQVVNSMLDSFKKNYDHVEEKFWEEFQKEVKADELIDLIVPIYDKHYSEEDIDELIKFYNSPIGMKMTETLPLIAQESMVAGQQWGKDVAERVILSLKLRGYIK